MLYTLYIDDPSTLNSVLKILRKHNIKVESVILVIDVDENKRHVLGGITQLNVKVFKYVLLPLRYGAA